ncbi:MAG: 4-hydroxybenzoyl-CoA thioesterase family active site [uncultured Acetobacteraceae bacterium]|uniref:4-hydroxybenzoyl-CoA thioesterase family active site n=1 Tax=uncultured Acetobacteraceae bacterium TaxID=169975 RepID=A0A6J4JG92_9PROT|nr:MAG: 4-hydroxybenzoyl-CoA thioesterase family active site [uncultured Acetobacteraceae bacterium]
MLTNTRRLVIEWGDCDPAGIVFYPRYFAMFDASTAALFQRALGVTKKTMLKRYDVVGFPMVDTRATFKAPCAFGDEVRIESTVTEFRRASFDVHHRLLRDDGAVVAVEGFETRVWVGRHPDKPDGIKALPIPEDLIARFRDPSGAP